MSETAVDRLQAVARFERAGKYNRQKGTGRCIGCVKEIPLCDYPVECIQRTFWQPARALCETCFPLWVELNKCWKVAKELMKR